MTITLISAQQSAVQPWQGNPIQDPGSSLLVERSGGTLTHFYTSPADGTINTDLSAGAIVGTPLIGPWRACTPGLPVSVVISSSQIGALTIEESSNGSAVASSRLVGPANADLQGATTTAPYFGGATPVLCGGVPQGCRFTTTLTYYRVVFTPLKTSNKVVVVSQQRAT